MEKIRNDMNWYCRVEFTNYAVMQLQFYILYIDMLMSTHKSTQTLISLMEWA